MCGWLVDLSPLRRHRDFRLLFVGQVVSMAGSAITLVALPFQVFHETGSSLAVGLIGAAELVLTLLLALVAGALADAIDRRRRVIATTCAGGRPASSSSPTRAARSSEASARAASPV